MGELEYIKGSTRIIDRKQLTSPAQIGFNKSGTVLLITEKATNTLTTYRVNEDGTAARRPLKRPSALIDACLPHRGNANAVDLQYSSWDSSSTCSKPMENGHCH